MTTDPKTYIATTVLNEESIVTYRTLSRVSKIHTNVAKELLYDFHRQQATRKPGSVHATYLLSGTKRQTAPTVSNGLQPKDAGNSNMQSSSFMSSTNSQQDPENESMPVRSIILVREEDLDGVKSQLEVIDFIHIYSLESGSLKNLQILSAGNHDISDRDRHEDPLEYGKQYGVIQNSNVKRRTGPRPIPRAASTTTAPRNSSKAVSKAVDSVENEPSQKSNDESRAHPPGPNKPTQSAKVCKQPGLPPGSNQSRDKKQTGKKQTLRRDQSDIFKSFSKSRTTVKREDTDSSLATSPPLSGVESADPSGPEDEPMPDASEDEQMDDFASSRESTNIGSAMNAKKQRDERLRRMMDEDDEPSAERGDTPAGEVNAEELPNNRVGSEDDAKMVQIAPPGVRRRGRRRVMRKKTVKDEEGYLVTREEQVWESFSEDEPEPRKVNIPTSTAASLAQGKKSIGKPGKGNIMSFFSKK